MAAAVQLHQAGELQNAAAIYRQILDRRPDHSEALYRLGLIAYQTEENEAAVELIGRALAIDPGRAGAHNTLGVVLQKQGRQEEAVASFQRAIAAGPNLASAHSNLGILLKNQGKSDQAITCFQRALAINPNFAQAHNNIGNLLKDQGKLGDAVVHFRHALDIDPRLGTAHSNLLFTLNLSAAASPEEILAESRRWDAIHAAPLSARIRPQDNPPDPERRLRVGYVSPDFRAHSVSYFVEPLLANHDRGSVEIFCYAEVPRPDEITARLQALADGWRSTVGLTDAEVAARIREDQIDVLIDLAGHTANHRLLAFAERPAPVQVTWLGYGASTGMTAIDYRLSDPVVDPEGIAEGQYTETLVRLPNAFFCYAPPEDAPEVGPLPALDHGHLTFGCFNNLNKVAPAVVEIWARVLHRIPESRLLMKTNKLRDEALCRRYLDEFAVHGIDEGRVGLLPAVRSVSDHLAAYGRVDIVLDPFPYNGGATSLEGIWMGVPMVSLRGDRFVSRMGASILTQLGLNDLVAESPEAYVEIATDLARDLDRLANLRNGLRPRMAASPLCDTKTFAREVEAAFREMWRSWCDEKAGRSIRS